MMYEAIEFARIIKEADREAYESLKQLSRTVLEITEQARLQNGIIFESEKQ